MSDKNEGFEAPKDPVAKEALNQLQKEGDEAEKAKNPEPKKEETKIEEKPKEEPKKQEPPKEEPKIERTPTMVEAYKLKIAEDQKGKALERITELESELEKVSKQKAPITETQKENIADEIKAIAEEAGVDAGFLTKFADSILKRAKPGEEVTQTLEKLKEKEILADQLNQYSTEFSKDIEPLVKEKYQLSDAALSQLKSELKDLAFSETYAKVPLKEIFKMKEDALGLKEPKKSSEGKGIKARAGEVVDLENLDEDSFKNLPDAEVEKLASRNSSGWKTPVK